MSVTKPIILNETGQAIKDSLDGIKSAIEDIIPSGSPVRIKVVTMPTTIMYAVGDTLDLTGLVVCAVYSNNSMYDITDLCVFSPADGSSLTLDDSFVDVSWQQTDTGRVFTTSFSIEVLPVKIVTWADGTDEEIANMLEAHYNGDIDIHDYWTVGESRQIDIGAIAATSDFTDYYEAQSINMVLVNSGGKELVDPINGKTECAFVLGMDSILAGVGGRLALMNPTNTNTGGWDDCKRRAWCNTNFRNAVDDDIRGIFKKIVNTTADGNSDTTVDSEDYFFLAAEKEVHGVNTNASSNAELELSQFKYFETSANKYRTSSWFNRSPHKGNTGWVLVNGSTGASGSSDDITNYYALVLFGAI